MSNSKQKSINLFLSTIHNRKGPCFQKLCYIKILQIPIRHHGFYHKVVDIQTLLFNLHTKDFKHLVGILTRQLHKLILVDYPIINLKVLDQSDVIMFSLQIINFFYQTIGEIKQYLQYILFYLYRIFFYQMCKISLSYTILVLMQNIICRLEW